MLGGQEQSATVPQRAYEPEAEPGYDDREPEYDEGDGLDDPAVLEGELRDWIRAEAEQLVGPRLEQYENQRREERILALADRYPRLAEPEVVNAIAGQLDRLARQTGDDSVRTDPKLVEAFFKALEADRIAAAETPVDAPGRGAVLESGAGPRPPKPAVDPIAASYARAFAPPGPDPLTS